MAQLHSNTHKLTIFFFVFFRCEILTPFNHTARIRSSYINFISSCSFKAWYFFLQALLFLRLFTLSFIFQLFASFLFALHLMYFCVPFDSLFSYSFVCSRFHRFLPNFYHRVAHFFFVATARVSLYEQKLYFIFF